MEKKIITISREYGSGGRQIGLVAAKKLGMEFYDKELIDAAAKEIGFPAEIIADREQRLTNSLLYNFAMGTLYGLSYPKEPKLIDRADLCGAEEGDRGGGKARKLRIYRKMC